MTHMITTTVPASPLKPYGVTLLIATLLHVAIFLQFQPQWKPFSFALPSQPGHSLQLDLQVNQQVEASDHRKRTRPERNQLHQTKPVIADHTPESETLAKQTEAELVSIEEDVIATETSQQRIIPVVAEQVYHKRYIAELLAHIERHKYYPRSARRRGITGDVSINLRVESDGSVSHLETDANYRVLSSAARESIEAAIPMPHPVDNIQYPVNLSFNMHYTLQ